MPNLQYIGARYVPEVFKNPDDGSAAWKSGVSYENLIIVTYLDDSYTSRKPVPSSVGDPASNPDYWAKTGDFNAALTSLSNRMTTAENNISDMLSGCYLAGKNVVVYGDSTVQYNHSYMNLACDAVGATCTNRAVGGTRMSRGSDNGASLIAAANDIADFDYVFLCYGTNEWQHSANVDELRQDVNTLINAVYSKDPAAKIIFVLPFYSYRVFGTFGPNINWHGLTLKRTNEIIENQLRNRWNVPVINFYNKSSVNSFNYTSLLENNSGVYVHPLAPLRSELASIVLNGTDDNNFYYHEEIIDLLTSYDFYQAQKNVSTAEYNTQAGRGTGLLLKVLNGVDTVSGTKILFANNYYELCGYATDEFTLTLEATNTSDVYTYACDSGYFNIPISINSAFYKIKFSTAADIFIRDLHFNIIDPNADAKMAYAGFGHRLGCSIHSDQSSNVTFTDQLTYTEHKEGISLSWSKFNVTNTITSGSKIFNMKSGFNAGQKFFIATKNWELTSGVWARTNFLLMLSGDIIYAAQQLAPGSYDIAPMFIPVDYNESVIR